MKRSLMVLGVSIVVVTMMWFRTRNVALEQQLVVLKRQIAAGEAAERDTSRVEEELKAVTEQAKGLSRELARLRSETTALRTENTELRWQRPAASAPLPPGHSTEVSEHQPYQFTPEQSAFWMERLNFGKRLGLALRTLAGENNGQLPEDVTEIAKWLAKNDFPLAGDTGPLFGVGVKSFELIYNGNLNDLSEKVSVPRAFIMDALREQLRQWPKLAAA